MRILFFTPYYRQPRGNTTTAKRIVDSMIKLGIQVSVFSYLENESFVENLDDYDFVHILHATRFAAWAKNSGVLIEKPYMITMGGTDINLDLQSNIEESVFNLIDRASFITVFTEDAKQKVKDLHMSWEAKTIVISQTVSINKRIYPDTNYDSPRFLLPAGLRPVKDVLHTLPALDRLLSRFPTLKFTIIGAILDKQVYQQIEAAALTRPWLTYAGEIPFEQMSRWYNKHNIIVNSSISEGQSLAIMEAMLQGKPVLARRNKANESIIQHGVTGWLYEDMNEFITCVVSIMTDTPLREQVTQNAQMRMNHSPLDEAKAYIHLYRRSLSNNPSGCVCKG